MKRFDKYLKRWETLTEKRKVLFFEAYLNHKNMCFDCIHGDEVPLSISERFHSQCMKMFPWDKGLRCPCYRYRDKIIKDHPPTVIEYCLIKDGWIDK